MPSVDEFIKFISLWQACKDENVDAVKEHISITHIRPLSKYRLISYRFGHVDDATMLKDLKCVDYAEDWNDLPYRCFYMIYVACKYNQDTEVLQVLLDHDTTPWKDDVTCEEGPAYFLLAIDAAIKFNKSLKVLKFFLDRTRVDDFELLELITPYIKEGEYLEKMAVILEYWRAHRFDYRLNILSSAISSNSLPVLKALIPHIYEPTVALICRAMIKTVTHETSPSVLAYLVTLLDSTIDPANSHLIYATVMQVCQHIPNLKVIKQLIAWLDPTYLTNDRLYYLLHMACRHSTSKVVKFLLTLGYKPGTSDEAFSLECVAQRSKDPRLLHLLKQHQIVIEDKVATLSSTDSNSHLTTC